MAAYAAALLPITYSSAARICQRHHRGVAKSCATSPASSSSLGSPSSKPDATSTSTSPPNDQSGALLGSPSEVYVACTPLKGLEHLGRLLGDEGYSDRLEHTTVLVRHPGDTGCMAYDFLPVDPTSPETAVALASGGTVAGILRTRRMESRGPSRHPWKRGKWCWKVGMTLPGLGGDEGARGVDAAVAEYQVQYDSRLSLDGNSCRDHTAALCEFLTGVKGLKMPE
mmetsp:Transcript_26312/g.65911  ORF Transcript_26312/g.65911 Transcript_26312/m.65911 type:complete len:226 (-) Transcript_26312:89-766(-)